MSEGGTTRLGLKKLFRASQKPDSVVNPLPIPDNLPPPANHSQQPPPQQQTRLPDQSKRRHHHHTSNKDVTPFPLDVGRNQLTQGQGDTAALTPAAPTPTPHLGAPPVPPPPRPSRDIRAPPQPTHNPTLAEIQAMEEAGAYEGNDHHAPIYAARSRRGTDSSSIEGWLASTQPQTQRGSMTAGGPEPAYASPYGSQLPSPSSQPGFFLPPGARPPSPGGANTPPVAPRMGHMSQSSIPNASNLPPPPTTAGYPGDLDAYAAGRNRGYSSASQSGRGSDHEGVGGAAGGGGGGGSAHHGAKLNKPQLPVQAGRSPLAQTYSSDMRSSHSDVDLGKPQPSIPEAPTYKPEKEKKSFWGKFGDRKSKDKTGKSKENLSLGKDNLPLTSTAPKEVMNNHPPFEHLDRAPSVFSQMPPRPSEDAHRASADDYREGSLHGHTPSIQGHQIPCAVHGAARASSTHGHGGGGGGGPASVGHGFEPSGLRARGLDLHLRRDEPEAGGEDDVTSVVRKLCSTRETTFPMVLDLCERINSSDSSDVVGREAARSIRKVFQKGADNERRMAARVWLITMGNVSVKDYHRHATSRKMIQAIEPILKHEAKPTVSSSTYKTTKEIVSGVTYTYHANRSCEHLLELWNKVRAPGDPEFGTPLPDDYLPITPEPARHQRKKEEPRREEFPRPVITAMAPSGRSPLPSPAPSVLSRPPSEPLSKGMHSVSGPGSSPPQVGIPYAAVPDHDDDMRRLFDDCNRAISTANKLHEACVFTRPDMFEMNTNLHELQRKALKKQEQLTTQMGWAQAEAERSRRIANSVPTAEQGSLATPEESALEILFKAHGALTDTLREYDELSERCVEERQMREVQERSKKDTRMDRRQQMDMLAAPGEGLATSSRSPSPSHNNNRPLPPENGRSPRTTDSGHGHSERGHADQLSTYMSGVSIEPKRSRSPSPHGPLPAPPKIGTGQSPPRSGSPLGRSRVPGPRPLPNPGSQFKSVSSNPNLVAASDSSRFQARAGSGSSNEGAPTSNSSAAMDGEDENGAPTRPSRKALGKRRAIPDEDNDFDPNDMFIGAPKKPDPDSDSHSITADEVYLSKPIVYAYDAWAEAMQREKEEAARAKSGAGTPGSPTTVPPPATPTMAAPVVSAR